MKKIAKGYYIGVLNGIYFDIIKVEGLNKWYWKIGNKGGEDWFDTKIIAKLAAEEAIVQGLY